MPHAEVLDTIDICLAHRHHTAEITEIAKVTEISPVAEATELIYHLWYIEGRIEKYHSGEIIGTLVGGIITKRKAFLVNVGDSRAYYLTKSEIKQISKDHSYVEELVAMGAITREEARTHPKKNIITRALGVDSSVKADYFEQPLHMGDGILLCSDGLSNIVTDAEMLDAFRRYNTPEKVCEYLLNLALDRGARDNVSVVLVKI